MLVRKLGLKPLRFYCALLKSICGASRWRSLAPQMLFIMVDTKSKYLDRFKKIYELKNGRNLSDEVVFEYFENLVCLVEAVIGKSNINKIMLPPKINDKRISKEFVGDASENLGTKEINRK